mmetsp:Transcript_55412/g.179757  ORF Transcript_55412/g.179757 Transcript_55412/m.179757 type:complete len:80 (+) Transcript_55412:1417-1656(+)
MLRCMVFARAWRHDVDMRLVRGTRWCELSARVVMCAFLRLLKGSSSLSCLRLRLRAHLHEHVRYSPCVCMCAGTECSLP